MLETVAIVGRPNVGKSTLFNRLTKTRDAIVSDYPGLTRDRQYGVANLSNREVILIDTGGIGDPKTQVEELMTKQTEIALEEAQMVLFLVDAKSGLLPSDQILAHKLRKLGKPVIVAINKTENLDSDIAKIDFCSFGLGECFPIAAEHGVGIKKLVKAILEKLPPEPETEELEAETNKTKITFVGRPNVGKSTLINRILGEERVVAHDMPGTTRDTILIDFTRLNKEYILIDTAGVRRKSKVQEKIEKFSIIKTLQAIAATDVAVLLIDAQENITDQDLKLLSFIIEEGKALVIAVNKWDNLPHTQRDKIKSELDRRLSFIDFANIHFISALHGTGVGDLFKSINNAYLSATKKLNTAEVNKILELAVKTHQPPLGQGKEIKLLYAHAGNQAPPTIIIHGKRANLLPESYRRYLEHFFRKALKLSGTPIRIIFKG